MFIWQEYPAFFRGWAPLLWELIGSSIPTSESRSELGSRSPKSGVLGYSDGGLSADPFAVGELMDGLTRPEVARELGVEYATLSQLIARGFIRPSISLPLGDKSARGYRRTLLFSREDVEASRVALENLTWMASVTPDSWHRLTEDGLLYTLLTARYARQADLMRPGNRMLFYVTGVSRFAGFADVVGRKQNKNTVWPLGVFPFRIPLKPRRILDEVDGVDVKQLIPSLSFIRKPSAWAHYFRGTIRLIDSDDFDRVVAAMDRNAPPLISRKTNSPSRA